MRIVIDLDGPVYEYARTARYMINHYIRKPNELPLLPPVAEFWTEWWPKEISKEEWGWLNANGIKLGLFRYGHVTRGAIVGLRALHEAGHSLVVGTHRPEPAVPDTLAWLSYLNLPWSDVHILSNEEPKTQINGDILVDDKPANILPWLKLGRSGILFDRPWNKQPSFSRRAYDWEAVIDHVAAITEIVSLGSSDSGHGLAQGIGRTDEAIRRLYY